MIWRRDNVLKKLERIHCTFYSYSQWCLSKKKNPLVCKHIKYSIYLINSTICSNLPYVQDFLERGKIYFIVLRHIGFQFHKNVFQWALDLMLPHLLSSDMASNKIKSIQFYTRWSAISLAILMLVETYDLV